MSDRIETAKETAGTIGRVAREPLKDSVKEAMREYEEEEERTLESEDAGNGRRPGRILVQTGLVASGVLIGFVIATRGPGSSDPLDFVTDKAPIGADEGSMEPAEQSHGEEYDDLTTSTVPQDQSESTGDGEPEEEESE